MRRDRPARIEGFVPGWWSVWELIRSWGIESLKYQHITSRSSRRLALVTVLACARSAPRTPAAYRHGVRSPRQRARRFSSSLAGDRSQWRILRPRAKQWELERAPWPNSCCSQSFASAVPERPASLHARLTACREAAIASRDGRGILTGRSS